MSKKHEDPKTNRLTTPDVIDAEEEKGTLPEHRKHLDITKKTQLIDINRLKPYEHNAKAHPKSQIEKIKNSILDFGFKQPIVVDKNFVIIVGHARRTAAKQLDWQYVPTIVATDLSAKKANKYRLLDNRTNESEWLLDDLVKSLDEIGDRDMYEEFNDLMMDQKPKGYDDEELENKVNKPTDEELFVKPGDLRQLGQHRIICGDSTLASTRDKLLQGIDRKIDCVFTDPPYGVSYTGVHTKDAKKRKEIANDSLSDTALQSFLQKVFEQLARITKDKPGIYVCYASKTHIEFELAIRAAGLSVKQQIIWSKQMVLSRSDYHWAHEPILYCGKEKSNDRYGDRTWKTIVEEGVQKSDLMSMKKSEIIDRVKSQIDRDSVWNVKKDNGQDYVHPTQKPVKLAMRAIMNSSPIKGLVADAFSGSGSTLIAAEATKRQAFVCELDPKYVQACIMRWQILTKKQAVKLN